MSKRCINDIDIVTVINEEHIEAVIVGSDAVAQHHPLLSRMVFPSKRFISFSHPASDKLFPNPFWGEFLDYVDYPVSVSLMSVSNQQSNYDLFTRKEKDAMMRYITRMSYISVRDNWTQNMYHCISGGRISHIPGKDLTENIKESTFALNGLDNPAIMFYTIFITLKER